MTEDRELDETRTLLREFDYGTLAPLDLDEVMRRGDRARRIAVLDRALAIAAVAAILVGVGLGIGHLTSQPTPPVAPSPTPTPSNPAPSPSGSTVIGPVPSVAFTTTEDFHEEGPVAVGFAADGTGSSIWAVTGSSAGKPGHLWAASPDRPGLRLVADVGTSPTSLAVVPGREWVVNDAGRPADKEYKAGTVDEFDTSGRLLHEYKLPVNPGFVYVAARGTDAWTLTPTNANVVVTHLAGGRQDVIATLTEPNRADAITVGIAVRGDGMLVVLTSSTSPAGLRLWTVDPTTGASSGPVALPLGAWAPSASLAVQGNRVLVAGRNDSTSTPALVAVDGTTVRPLTGCGALTLSVAADATGAWLTTADGDASQGLLVAPVGATGCGAALRQPGSGTVPATSGWDGNVLVLAATSLTGISLDQPTPGPSTDPSSTPAVTASHPCAGSDLQVTESGGDGAGGSAQAVLQFRNTGTDACWLRGYPTVVAEGSAGGVLRATQSLDASWGGSAVVATVPLAPGQAASATLQWGDNPVGNATTCATYPVLAVTPPGTKDTTRIPLSIPVSGCTGLQVLPVVSGTDGTVPAS